MWLRSSHFCLWMWIHGVVIRTRTRSTPQFQADMYSRSRLITGKNSWNDSSIWQVWFPDHRHFHESCIRSCSHGRNYSPVISTKQRGFKLWFWSTISTTHRDFRGCCSIDGKVVDIWKSVLLIFWHQWSFILIVISHWNCLITVTLLIS